MRMKIDWKNSKQKETNDFPTSEIQEMIVSNIVTAETNPTREWKKKLGNANRIFFFFWWPC